MRLTPDRSEILLRETARDFLRSSVPLARVLEVDRDPDGLDPAVWSGGAELGWTTMALPERLGGGGGRLLELGIVLEEVGYAGWAGPLAPLAYATAVLSAVGDQPLAERALARIASGGVIVAEARLDLDGPVTSRSTAEGLELTAEQWPLAWAHKADQLLVVARSSAPSNTYDLALVDVSAPGVTITAARSLDNERTGVVRLEGVSTYALLGRGLDARQVDTILAPARALAAALLVGQARRILDLTADHLRTREQFGRALGTLPTAQLACADMAIESEGARLASYDALSRLDLGVPADAISATSAYAAGQAGARASVAAAQLQGAMGFMREYPFQIFFRRAKAGQIRLGALRGQRLALARVLLPEVRHCASLALDGPDPLRRTNDLMAGAT